MAAGPARPAAADTPKTVVSLTFDDGDADQMAAAQTLHQDGLPGTFYIITSAIGNPTYMTMSNLRTLAADGDEIGDHTVTHLSMPLVSLPEARRQICDARNILTGWGFKVTDFAYPDATYTHAVEQVARQCGLNSARIGGGIRNGECPNCATAETMPPRDPYAVRTPGQEDTSWSVQALEQVVQNAEANGGGWIPFVFHHVCSDPNASTCSKLSITPAHFAQFAQWLAGQRANGVSVQTVGHVVGGPDHREVRAAAASPHGVQNDAMRQFGPAEAVSTANESTNQVTGPKCWMYGGYGQNDAQWERIPGGHDTPYAERLTMTNHASGDAKLLEQFDMGQCSLAAQPGQAYQLTSWYTSTIRTQFAIYYRQPSGRWVYWTSSPYFAASSTWKQAQWQTPPLPAGASAVSFGLELGSAGQLTTSDYTFRTAPIKVGVIALRVGVVLLLCAIAARIAYMSKAPISRKFSWAYLSGLRHRARHTDDAQQAADAEEPETSHRGGLR
jgi:peptidoglycan/xylan/chitin deacetylase (PgdA/CDA1 family)